MLKIYLQSIRSWIFFTYILIIIILSLQPNYINNYIPNLWKYDKLIHLIEYMFVGILLINALQVRPINKRVWKIALMFLIIFPIFDELLQFYSPSRVSDINDAIVDIVGGIIGAYIKKYY